MVGLQEQFNRAMWKIYSDAKTEVKYNPEYFRKMLDDFGGLETAKRLLSKDTLSNGFTKLWELERLDLTVEALICDNKKYWKLFTDEELKEAKKRLDDLGYFKNL